MLFIFVMSPNVSGHVSEQEAPRKKLYAEGVTVETGDNKEVQDLLQELHNILKKHGLRLNPGNSDVMWIGNMRWTYI